MLIFFLVNFFRGNEEYVFNGRPQTQKTPTDKILSMWYSNMMRLALEMGMLENYSVSFKLIIYL